MMENDKWSNVWQALEPALKSSARWAVVTRSHPSIQEEREMQANYDAVTKRLIDILALQETETLVQIIIDFVAAFPNTEGDRIEQNKRLTTLYGFLMDNRFNFNTEK